MLLGMHGYRNVQLPAGTPNTLLYTVPSINESRPFGVNHNSEPVACADLNTASAARVETSPLILLSATSIVRSAVHANSIGTRPTSRGSLLVVLLLVLLDFLSLALTLFVELLVLGLDLGIAMFGLGAAAASTGIGS